MSRVPGNTGKHQRGLGYIRWSRCIRNCHRYSEGLNESHSVTEESRNKSCDIANTMASSLFEYDCEAVRVHARRLHPRTGVEEQRRFSVDPNLTTFTILRSILVDKTQIYFMFQICVNSRYIKYHLKFLLRNPAFITDESI